MENKLSWKLVDEIAAQLGASDPQRMKWRQRDTGVSLPWRIKIVEALARRKVDVSFSDFDTLPKTPGRIAA